MRTFMAALLGCIAMYIWTSLAFTKLPLGDVGIRTLPKQSNVLPVMQRDIRERAGLYLFPAETVSPNASTKDPRRVTKAIDESLALHPSGFLVYHPAGARPFTMGRWLAIEFVTELVEAWIVVFLLVKTRLTGFWSRVGFVLLAGLLVAIGTNIPYWNWYGFPMNYIASYMLIQVVGFLCVGLVAALVLKNRIFGVRVRQMLSPAEPAESRLR